MRGERRPPGRRSEGTGAELTQRVGWRAEDEVARLRAGVWAALEALEAGDQWLAVDLLLELAEGGPEEGRWAA